MYGSYGDRVEILQIDYLQLYLLLSTENELDDVSTYYL